MAGTPDDIIARVKVREVAGVFRTRKDIEAAVDDLLLAGIDRADIDLMASVETVREKLGAVYVAAEELPDIPRVPRRAFIARDDVKSAMRAGAALLAYVGAMTAAVAVVASGGALATALAAAVAGGAAVGGIGAAAARMLGIQPAKELEEQLAAGGLVLWVRVRTPERENTAQQILRRHRADAVRVHEIDIEKRLEDLPLASIRPDPWLGDESLAGAKR
jgi:hypothetical protein